MRRLVLWAVTAGAMVLTGCASFKPVERGDWRRVWHKAEGAHPVDAPQDIITRDEEDKERAESIVRAWQPPPEFEAPYLLQETKVTLKPGEVKQFRFDESEEVQLLAMGGAVDVFFNEAKKKDEWKGNNDVTKRESTLFLKGKKEGTATLRVIAGEETKDVVVTVTP